MREHKSTENSPLDQPRGMEATEVEPNLEHAYVHYMDHKLDHWKL